MVLSWARGTQPLVAREGSLEAQVEALPAGRDGVSGGTPRCAQLGKFSAIPHGTRSLFSKGEKKTQTHPDERSFSPAVSAAGYKSSLGLLGSKLCGLLPSTVRSETCGCGAASPAPLPVPRPTPRARPGGVWLRLGGIRGLRGPMDPAHSPLDPGSRPPGCALENKCPLPRARPILAPNLAAVSGEYLQGLVLPPAGGGP